MPINLQMKRLLQLLPDELYIRLKWRYNMKRPLHLKNPKSFNEKLQWLKLYDRRPEYTVMVDKFAAKQFVADKIGEEHIIPTLGVWKNVEEIEWNTLPEQFVLKCTHDCGGLVICTDKSKLDIEAAKIKLSKSLKKNYYLESREWPYKNVPPRIICEKYMEDESGYLKDYKWFCFDGEPKAFFIATDRNAPGEETKFDFFDADYNHLPFTNGHPNAPVCPPKPAGFEEMKKLASILSKGIPQVRVDFYDVNGHIYFGELTLSHWGGTMPFTPDEWDYTFGSWIKLPQGND